MIAEQVCGEPGAVAGWSETLDALHGRCARRFARAEVRERARRYLAGLLDRVEHKNGWQLAEAIGGCGAKGVQRLLNAATWYADAVRDGDRVFETSWTTIRDVEAMDYSYALMDLTVYGRQEFRED